jgi:hypothetical protein
VAEVSRTIFDGIREGNPAATVVVWPYSASNTWSKEDRSQSELLRRLPSGMTLMTEFAKEGTVTIGDVSIPAYDYTISLIGPAERFTRQAELARRVGLGLWVKTEHAIALELVQTPYIPVLFRWAERFARIRSFPEVRGVFANWQHYGFMPTLATELFRRVVWEPAPEPEALLRRIALREFGPRSGDAAVAAWREWSEAFAQYPFSSAMALGVIQKGPAHPFFLDPDYRPLHGDSRQFKNDLSWTHPYGAALVIRQLEHLERGWLRGIEHWERVVASASPDGRPRAVREGGIARAALACFRSAAHLARFMITRDRLHGESDPRAAAELLREMTSILEAELVNARQALEPIRLDSRLGYANSGRGEQAGVPRGGIYSPASIEKKIRQVERLLGRDLPDYARRRGLR